VVRPAEQTIHAVVFKDAHSDQWVAMSLEYDITTQGDSEDHAVTMLREAIQLYLDELGNEEAQLLHQSIEGEPRIHRIAINATPVLP
jgi:predicted RNase H-like HicB family nuclease